MNISWLFRMAWRDSRRSRHRLFLFMSAIVLGIAALVAINSFSDNLARSIDDQARELLGSDLSLSASKPVSSTLLDKVGSERSTEISFASMVLFPRTGGVRLAQVKGLEGGFPYYGTWESQPANAPDIFRQGMTKNQRVALVDDALLIQFGAQPGDSVRVGNLSFLVVGRVLKTPGQSAVATTVAPTVFIPALVLPETGLLQRGSRVSYRFHYRFPDTTNVEKLVKRFEPVLDKQGINYDTVAERKRQTGRAFEDLGQFLNLVAFVALLLGCVGVASAVHLYAKEKIASVAILRCLGTSGWQAFLIYLIQTSLMGLFGAVLGSALGSLVQLVLPDVFGSFLPVTVDTTLSWKAIGQGVGTGLLVAVLFALLPLLSIRTVSPLLTLRAGYDESANTTGRDPLRWGVYILILLFIFGFAFLQTMSWKTALGFTGGLLVAFGILTGMGQLLMWAVKRFFPVSWSFVWRQSLASLYRPNNQTLILIISIGLGAFLISTLYLTQNLLLSRVAFSANGSEGTVRPNMVLFDIQNEQKNGVLQLVKQHNMPVVQSVPVVTMRLADINGRSVEAIRQDTASKIPESALTREYRVTYRDSLIDSEKLMTGKGPFLQDGVPHISVEKDYFARLKLKLGDTLTFNVQGAPIQTIVSGTRQIDWNRVQTNFLVLFPAGVLEQAPQFHVLMTRVADTKQSAAFQRDLVRLYPNVSAIDLGLILKTVDEILDKISFVIRFMALFCIFTGLLVLGSSVVISRYQRIKESVLLRTLGASRRQILNITAIEYLFLGVLAALSGILLSVFGTWALAYFVFESPFRPDLLPLLLIILVISVLTTLIGLLNSRDVVVRPPLEVLRAEG